LPRNLDRVRAAWQMQLRSVCCRSTTVHPITMRAAPPTGVRFVLRALARAGPTCVLESARAGEENGHEHEE
jgi:hypothetical protein